MAGTGMPGSWQVGNQVVGYRPDGTGKAVKGMIVHFQTGLGVASTVFVPDATYTAAAVRAAILAKVKVLDAVSQMTTSGKS